MSGKDNFKKHWVIALILVVFATMSVNPLSVRAENSDENQEKTASAPHYLKGEVDYVVPRGTGIKLKLASVPNSVDGMHLFDRDLDGNLLPAKVGQEITARTSEDLYVEDSKVIPEGTVFHGSVSKIIAPKRARLAGSLEIAFDSFTTPDGRKFAFKVQADTTKKSTTKSKAKWFGVIAAHTAGGAIVGALVAYQIFGLHNTIAMHGYNIAGGAAGGALIATGVALYQKGKVATLEPGDDLNMNIDTDLLLPATVEPTIKKASQNIEGLTMEVKRCKMINDGLEGHLLNVELVVDNETDKKWDSIDLYCEDTNGTRNPVSAGADIDIDNTQYIFAIQPHSSRTLRISFQIEYPKLKRQLIWLDHDDRQICYRQPLPAPR